MTTVNQANAIATEYAAKHEAFEAYDPIFVYGLHWVIGRSTTHHILISPTQEILTIPLGNLEIDTEVSRPHKRVEPLPADYKPPF